MNILQMENICKSFFGVYANENINLSVESGEIHALLGENGAGKTTLMNILFGIYLQDSGEIFYKGQKVQFNTPKDAINHGISMVHQHFSLINRLTVLENIILGSIDEGKIIDKKGALAKINTLAQKYNFEINPLQKVADLTVGQKQRVEIIKALYHNVELLILDEPTGVLTPSETEHFFGVLRKLKDEGLAIIIITHRMSEIMSISDRVTILRDGKHIKTLDTKDTNPANLSEHMIGRKLIENFDIAPTNYDENTLTIENLSLISHKIPVLKNISLNIKKGEILGIAGVDGNGQTPLAEVISGITKHTKGSINFKGEDISKLNVKRRFERGISYISDDRHNDSLVLDMSVEGNLILRDYKKFTKNGFLDVAKIKQNALDAIEKYSIKTSGTSQEKTIARLMSGGNQQKLVISREENAELIIANQPTRGLDMGATEFVRSVLLEKRNDGKSILLISADLEEIFAISDRIAVMFSGEIMAVLDKNEATLEKIGLLMGGVSLEN